MLRVDELVLDDEQIREWGRQRFPANEFTKIMRVNSNADTIYLDLIGQQAIPYDSVGESWYEEVNLAYSSFTFYTPEGLVQARAEYAPKTNVLVYKLVPWPTGK